MMTRSVRTGQRAERSTLSDYVEQMRYRALVHANLTAERTARREAERVAEIKSNFIAMMSHELRTPLNSIVGFSEILARPSAGVKESERISYAEMINRAGRHLTSVVNSILEMSKIQSGTYEIVLVEHNLIEILSDVVAMSEILAHEKGVMLARRWQAEEIVARVDETRFVQAMSNIVGNAIKFTEPGGCVTVACQVDAVGRVLVTVADSGVGMSKDEIDIALTPFGQASAGRVRGTEGTGLGLCIARDLTQLQGGRFAIESTPGVGTTITFAFPPVEARSAAPNERGGDGTTATASHVPGARIRAQRPARPDPGKNIRKAVVGHVES